MEVWAEWDRLMRDSEEPQCWQQWGPVIFKTEFLTLFNCNEFKFKNQYSIVENFFYLGMWPYLPPLGLKGQEERVITKTWGSGRQAAHGCDSHR